MSIKIKMPCCGYEYPEAKNYGERYADTFESVLRAICPNCDRELFTIIDLDETQEDRK